MTNREIGRRLGLAEPTIKNAVMLILAALGVTRRAHAATYAANARDGRLGQIQCHERRSLPVPHGHLVNSVGTTL